MKRPEIIGIDFDGTCVTHRYPKIGESIGAEQWLRRFNRLGARLVLVTMRDGAELKEAVRWLEAHGVELYGINHHPGQKRWTMSPKPYAHLYIDDAALGVPLIYPGKGRPYVDWLVVGPTVVRMLKGGGTPEVIHGR